jgi:hypothetical protein
MSNQIHGQELVPGLTTRWQPIAAVKQPDGTYALKVDTELVLDAANINLANLKVGSTDQTSNNLRYLKTLDDGTVFITSVSEDILGDYKASETQDRGPFPHYFGLTNEEEDWVIIEQTRSGNDDSFRYFAGSGSFSTAWTNRAGHAYDYFHNIF